MKRLTAIVLLIAGIGFAGVNNSHANPAPSSPSMQVDGCTPGSPASCGVVSSQAADPNLGPAPSTCNPYIATPGCPAVVSNIGGIPQVTAVPCSASDTTCQSQTISVTPCGNTTPTTILCGSNGICYSVPSNAIVPCPGVTATTGPTRALITPNKTMTVTGGGPVAGGALTSYTVNITSSVACFSVDEPINLYTLGNPNASALSPLFPANIPPQNKNHYTFTVDPATHAATFNLEVNMAALDATGLGVKAVWPQEAIERVTTIIGPATATPTPTAVPGSGTATPTPTSVPTATPTATPGGTAPAAPTATPTQTATPVPTGPFFLRTCVDPNPVPAGGTGTLYGQTTPGAVCTAAVTFSNSQTPPGFDGGPQTALSDGFVVFPFSATTTASAGRAKVTCTLNGQTQTSLINFLVAQPSTNNPAAGTLPVSVSASPSVVTNGQQLVLSANTLPGSVCVARITLTASAGIPFNGYSQLVPGNGLISWTFTVEAPGPGVATAIVDCIAGTATGEGTGQFTVGSP